MLTVKNLYDNLELFISRCESNLTISTMLKIDSKKEQPQKLFQFIFENFQMFKAFKIFDYDDLQLSDIESKIEKVSSTKLSVALASSIVFLGDVEPTIVDEKITASTKSGVKFELSLNFKFKVNDTAKKLKMYDEYFTDCKINIGGAFYECWVSQILQNNINWIFCVTISPKSEAFKPLEKFLNIKLSDTVRIIIDNKNFYDIYYAKFMQHRNKINKIANSLQFHDIELTHNSSYGFSIHVPSVVKDLQDYVKFNSQIQALQKALNKLSTKEMKEFEDTSKIEYDDYASISFYKITVDDIDTIIDKASNKFEMDKIKFEKAKIEAEKRIEMEKNIANGAIYFFTADSWIVLGHRVDANIFAMLKPYATYITKEDLEDMDDFYGSEGWKFKKEGLQQLAKTHNVYLDYVKL